MTKSLSALPLPHHAQSPINHLCLSPQKFIQSRPVMLPSLVPSLVSFLPFWSGFPSCLAWSCRLSSGRAVVSRVVPRLIFALLVWFSLAPRLVVPFLVRSCHLSSIVSGFPYSASQFLTFSLQDRSIFVITKTNYYTFSLQDRSVFVITKTNYYIVTTLHYNLQRCCYCVLFLSQ